MDLCTCWTGKPFDAFNPHFWTFPRDKTWLQNSQQTKHRRHSLADLTVYISRVNDVEIHCPCMVQFMYCFGTVKSSQNRHRTRKVQNAFFFFFLLFRLLVHPSFSPVQQKSSFWPTSPVTCLMGGWPRRHLVVGKGMGKTADGESCPI